MNTNFSLNLLFTNSAGLIWKISQELKNKTRLLKFFTEDPGEVTSGIKRNNKG